MPIAKSRKDLKENDPHKQRPDTDNMIKAIQDCLVSEDSRIWFVIALKVWSNDPRIEFRNLTDITVEDVWKGTGNLGGENYIRLDEDKYREYIRLVETAKVELEKRIESRKNK